MVSWGVVTGSCIRGFEAWFPAQRLGENMKVEFFSFEGCPNHEPALRLMSETVSELKIDADIEVALVTNSDDATSRKFLGSTSIRIDGRDIEIDEDEGTQYTMRCGVYRPLTLRECQNQFVLLVSKLLK